MRDLGPCFRGDQSSRRGRSLRDFIIATRGATIFNCMKRYTGERHPHLLGGDFSLQGYASSAMGP